MKLLILTLFLIASCTSAPSTYLARDFADIVALLPMDDIHRMTLDHMDNDLGFQAGMRFFQTKDWKMMDAAVSKKPSTKEMMKLIKEAGLDLEILDRFIYILINSMDFIGLSQNQKRSFASYLEELDELIPYDKLVVLLQDKIENSLAFKEFYQTVSSERMHELADKITKSQEFIIAAKEMVSMDIPVHPIIETIYIGLGWKKEYTTEHNSLDLD